MSEEQVSTVPTLLNIWQHVFGVEEDLRRTAWGFAFGAYVMGGLPSRKNQEILFYCFEKDGKVAVDGEKTGSFKEIRI